MTDSLRTRIINALAGAGIAPTDHLLSALSSAIYYRIENAADLEALPVKSVVRAGSKVFELTSRQRDFSLWHSGGRAYYTEHIPLPADLIWSPEATR